MQANIDDYEKLTGPGKSDVKEFDSLYSFAGAAATHTPKDASEDLRRLISPVS